VKRNLHHVNTEVQNEVLEEEGVSLLKSTIKRRLQEPEYRRFTTRCKPLKNRKDRKQTSEGADPFQMKVFWKMKPR